MHENMNRAFHRVLNLTDDARLPDGLEAAFDDAKRMSDLANGGPWPIYSIAMFAYFYGLRSIRHEAFPSVETDNVPPPKPGPNGSLSPGTGIMVSFPKHPPRKGTIKAELPDGRFVVELPTVAGLPQARRVTRDRIEVLDGGATDS
jgi:hypothetical protein